MTSVKSEKDGKKMGNRNGERLREEKIFINFIRSMRSYGFELLLQVDAICYDFLSLFLFSHHCST